MKNLKAIAAAALLLLAAAPALAGPKQGDYELGGQLGGTYYTGDVAAMGGGNVNLLINYTDKIAFGARLGFGAGGGDGVISLKGEGQYAIHINEKLSAYFGVMAGLARLDADDEISNDLDVGGMAGLKSYFTDNLGMFAELQGGALIGKENASYLGMGVGVIYKF